MFGRATTNGIDPPPPPDFAIVSMYWERRYRKPPAPAFKTGYTVLLSKPVPLKRNASVATLSSRVTPVT